MAKIIEVYPDAKSAKAQIESRKVFGWHSDMKINERGVYEVTFTRNDSTKENARLRKIEEDFTECSVAADYIERYNSHTVNKSKYRAIHPFFLVLAIYFMVSFAIQGGVLLGLSVLYKADPGAFVGEGIEISIDDKEVIIVDQDWSYDLNLEELGLSGLFAIFGYNESTLNITLESAMDFCYGYSLLNLAGALILLIFIIFKRVNSKTYYKAELQYVQNRKDLLNEKIDDLNERMDDLIEEAYKV